MSWPRQNFFLHYQVDKCWIFQEGVISWSGTNFQNNITELYGRQYRKLLRKDLGSERFNTEDTSNSTMYIKGSH